MTTHLIPMIRFLSHRVMLTFDLKTGLCVTVTYDMCNFSSISILFVQLFVVKLWPCIGQTGDQTGRWLCYFNNIALLHFFYLNSL